MSADLAAEQQQAKHSSEAILWTQPYFIYSALNNDTSCYGLAVSGGTPTIGTQIILWSWQGGQTSELWAFNGGQFVSNLGSNLVLGFGDPVEGGTPQEYYLVLVENNQSDQSQFWNMNPNTGLISNAQYPDRYVNVAGGLPTQGANIITYANQPGAANEMFILAPWFDGNTQQQPTWCYLQSELSDQNGQIVPYVLTVLDGYENGVLNVGLNSLGASGTPAQMWQYTKDRRLLNGSGTGNVLMPSYAWINGFERVAAARQLNPTTNLQHWGLEGKFPNMLNNWHTGQNIYVPGGSPYGNPTLELRPPPANTDDTGFFWYPMPSSPLNAIIAQAPQPFGFFSGDQLTAYQYINQQLNLGQGQTPDLRGQYLNVAPGATNEEMLLYAVQIHQLQAPSGVSASDWNTVVTQLEYEIKCVIAVQSLFADYIIWHNYIFEDNGTLLNGMINDAQMQDSKANLVAVGAAIAQGVVYTALSYFPFIGNVLSNLFNTAFNLAMMSGQISASPFDSAVSELYKQLSDQMTSIADQAIQMEFAILSDWGKLQAVYPLTLLNSNDPQSLSQNVLGENQATDIAETGYKIKTMQVLLPAKYQIYEVLEENSNPLEDIPGYAQYISDLPNTNLWRKCWIADSTDPESIPISQAIQTDLWDNGVLKSDFFHGNNGWAFAFCQKRGFNVDNGAWGVNVTITNQSPNLLTINAALAPKSSGRVGAPSSGTIYPYTSFTISGAMPSEANQTWVTIAFDIFDPEVSGGSAVASFLVYQSSPALFTGQTPVVSSQASSNGYVLSTPMCNQAFYIGNIPGTVQIGIYLP